ncbi:MAG: AAA family ATPase [Phycisphaerae bacterium]|nr:AAA family ATPase [Phycisphaerae bacterium]
MRTISIINQKGGCGKTTTAINLSGILARRGYRCLLVDMDPQSHCAAGLAIPEQRIDLDIGDALLAGSEGGGGAGVDRARLLWRVSRNLDLAPSRTKLAGLESSRGGLADSPDKHLRLAHVLRHFETSYDVCVVDCPPSIGILTYNALAASQDVLIPVQTAFFALQGATKQVSTIRSLSKRLEQPPRYHVLPTLHEESSALARDILDEIRRRFEDKVVPCVIRHDAALKEAASFGQPVVEYSPTSIGALDYTALAEWAVSVLGIGGMTSVRAPEASERPEVVVPTAPAMAELARRVEAVSMIAERAISPGETPLVVVPSVAHELAAVSITRSQDLAALARAASELRSRTWDGKSEVPPPPPGTPEAELAERSRREAMAGMYGARSTRSGALFVQPLAAGSSVAVAGEFNGWEPAAGQMRRNEAMGVWETCVRLPPGRWRYRLVVDGRWMVDPHNPALEPNPYHGMNSVIEVPAESGGRRSG